MKNPQKPKFELARGLLARMTTYDADSSRTVGFTNWSPSPDPNSLFSRVVGTGDALPILDVPSP
jgi:hypothetical protein